jgi:hypothetical protein
MAAIFIKQERVFMGIFVYMKRYFIWMLLSVGCQMAVQAQQKLVVSNPTGYAAARGD